MFQLTRPRGARQHGLRLHGRDRDVSTHAPARGATLRHTEQIGFIMRFNSRAREGRDFHALAGRYVPGGFNSRAREGRDPAALALNCLEVVFQLTRPRGARPLRHRAEKSEIIVSTHAPARGATLISLQNGHHGLVSTHAPARGATRKRSRRLLPTTRFNSRAREGRDSTRLSLCPAL